MPSFFFFCLFSSSLSHTSFLPFYPIPHLLYPLSIPPSLSHPLSPSSSHTPSLSFSPSFFPSLIFIGGSDGVIKRWDISGDGQKKETQIIRTAEQPLKNTKTEKTEKVEKTQKVEKFENILKNEISPESERNVPSASAVEVPRRRRFLDFYFQDAITAENIRVKSLQSGIYFITFYCFYSLFYIIFSFMFSPTFSFLLFFVIIVLFYDHIRP
jgi:hypothetical protein